MELLFGVSNQELTCISRSRAAAYSLRYLECVFAFTSDWDGFTKTAYFTHDGKTYEQLLTDDKCGVPSEVIKNGTIEVSVSGVLNNTRITTNKAVITVFASGFTETSENDGGTLTVKETLEDEINNAQTTANNAVTYANAAQNTADEAKSIAKTAQDTADNAESIANTAKTTAEETAEAVGDINGLMLGDKHDNLVSAINAEHNMWYGVATSLENNKADKADVGDIDNLKTTEKETVVGAVNELNGKIDDLDKVVNVDFTSDGTPDEVNIVARTKTDIPSPLVRLGKDESSAINLNGYVYLDFNKTTDKKTGETLNSIQEELQDKVSFTDYAAALAEKADKDDMDAVREELQDKVSFTDYAADIKAGVVKVAGSLRDGLIVSEDGFLQIYPATETTIDNRDPLPLPITCEHLDYAVRSVKPDIQSSIPDTLSVNTIYTYGKTAELLSLTLPKGETGDFIQVDFYSGETPTTLSIQSAAGITLDTDLIPEANTMYSLYFEYGTTHIERHKNTIMGQTSIGYAIAEGWRFSYAAYPYTEV